MYYKTCEKMAFKIDKGLYKKIFGEVIMAYGKWCYICKKDIPANRLKEHREIHKKEKDKIKKEK